MRVGFNFASYENLELLSGYDLPVLQFYTHVTSGFTRTFTDEQLIEIAALGKTMYVHTTFNTIPGKYFSKKFFYDQYMLCSKYKIKGLVVHIPNISMDDLVDGVKIFNVQVSGFQPIIYLEHVPGEYGASAELLGIIYSRLTKQYPRLKFGLCIDTCHVYSSGIDLSDVSIMNVYLDKIQKIGAPILIHLNDSHGELGSLIDRHAPLGTRIWTNDNYSSLQLLLTKPWDAVLELKPPEVIESLEFITQLTK
jgi:endonuclease IV